jgi:hypothetical protein
VKHDPCIHPHPKTPENRAFWDGVSARRQTRGGVFARTLFSISLNLLRVADFFVFPPAGFDPSLYLPAPLAAADFPACFRPHADTGACFRPQAFF